MYISIFCIIVDDESRWVNKVWLVSAQNHRWRKRCQNRYIVLYLATLYCVRGMQVFANTWRPSINFIGCCLVASAREAAPRSASLLISGFLEPLSKINTPATESDDRQRRETHDPRRKYPMFRSTDRNNGWMIQKRKFSFANIILLGKDLSTD